MQTKAGKIENEANVDIVAKAERGFGGTGWQRLAKVGIARVRGPR